MKPMQIIAIVGCLVAAMVGGWFMYMQNSEQFERAAQRGLPPELKQAASEAAALATTAVPSAAAIAAPADATTAAATTANAGSSTLAPLSPPRSSVRCAARCSPPTASC